MKAHPFKLNTQEAKAGNVYECTISLVHKAGFRPTGDAYWDYALKPKVITWYLHVLKKKKKKKSKPNVMVRADNSSTSEPTSGGF